MSNPSHTIIKSIAGNGFEIAMVETKEGKYYVVYETGGSEEPIFSDPIMDYKNATFMFDIKLKELQGH